MTEPPLTPATFHILLTLVEGPRHGFAIKRAVEERTEGVVRLGPGTLYAALARLVDSGHVRKLAPGRGAQPTPGPPSPTYRLTQPGRSALDRELDRLEHDLDTARALLRKSEGLSP